MKPILMILVAACFVGCVDTDTEPKTELPGLIDTNVDGKADSYTSDEETAEEVADACVVEGDFGCPVVGADCCDQIGRTCQEYTYYDHPRCLPKFVQRPLAFRTETSGGVFQCASTAKQDFPGTFLSVVGREDPSYDGRAFIVAEMEETALVAEQPVEDGLEWSEFMELFAFDDETLNARGYYYALEADRIDGFQGLYKGKLTSFISDDVWEIECWGETVVPTAYFDELGNVCLSEDGEVATNPAIGVQTIRALKFGSCMSFYGVEFDEGVYGYQALREVDFQGSDFTGAAIHFAHIYDANFKGANLELFDFGYSELSGAINQSTVVPAREVSCESTDGTIFCRQ